VNFLDLQLFFCNDKKNLSELGDTSTAELETTVPLLLASTLALDARTKNTENTFSFLNHDNHICKM